jgi:hypothetical protein
VVLRPGWDPPVYLTVRTGPKKRQHVGVSVGVLALFCEHRRDTNFIVSSRSPPYSATQMNCEWVIRADRATKVHRVKYLCRGYGNHSLELENVRSRQNEKKKPPKPDVVMRLFLHDTLTIRNLTKRIQGLDQELARAFVSFNRISESIEKENSRILDLLLEPILRAKRLEKARLQQQRDIARSFETEERIGRLLEARSDAISDIARQQHELGKVR